MQSRFRCLSFLTVELSLFSVAIYLYKLIPLILCSLSLGVHLFLTRELSLFSLVCGKFM